MRLQNVYPGDIIRAAGMHAVVLRKDRGQLTVQGICNQATRRVRATEIEKHWRQRGNT